MQEVLLVTLYPPSLCPACCRCQIDVLPIQTGMFQQTASCSLNDATSVSHEVEAQKQPFGKQHA